jgi:hypothetical protein
VVLGCNNGVAFSTFSSYDKVDHEDFSVISGQPYVAGDPLQSGSAEALQYSTMAQSLGILVRGRVSTGYWKVWHDAGRIFGPTSELKRELDSDNGIAQAIMLPDAFEGPLTESDAPPSPVSLL